MKLEIGPFAQEPRLMEAAELLTTRVRDLPRDPRYPTTEPRALLVGGFPRDAILGVTSKDADIEVYGVSPERLEDLLEELFPGRVNAVGRAFGILKVNLAPDLEFDVAIPRRESKSGQGHTGFLVESDPGMTTDDAARRRDFTINAISFDPLTGELLDPFHGMDDLANNVLRVVDEERFQDDPLRVYRAVQLVARMGLAIEPKSLELMRMMVAHGDLAELSKERVSEEMKKLFLKAEKPSVGFELMRELGIIARDYPELHIMIGTPQEPEWHPEGDVWIHTMMALDQAAKIIREEVRGFTTEEQLGIMAGTLCHDLGKPATTAMGEKEGIPRLRSLGHEEAGEEPTKQLLDKWAFGADVERAAIVIAMQHLKPGTLAMQKSKGRLTDGSYTNAVRKLVKRIYPVSWRVLIAASEADYRGRTLPNVETEPYREGLLFAKTITENNLDQEPTKPLIQGRDLLARGVKAGRQMGDLIRQIENLRDEGKIKTRDEALAQVDLFLKK